jgi:hypothetical protein
VITSQIEDHWGRLLSADQQEFVQAFLVTRSAGGAADMVGIGRSTALRYLNSPTIQASIRIAQKQLREECVVTPTEVINDLRLIRDMALGRIPVAQTKWVDGEPITRFVRQFDAPAANKAVENLGRVVGMFTDRKEISLPASDTQLKRRLEELLGVSLEIEDAQYSEVESVVAAPPPEPPTAKSEELNATYEQAEDDELRTILEAVLAEHKIPEPEGSDL